MSSKETRQLVGVGGSIAVTLPRYWINYYEKRLGDKVEIVTKGNKAIITLLDE